MGWCLFRGPTLGQRTTGRNAPEVGVIGAAALHIHQLVESVQALERIVGASGCMVQIRNRIEKVATSMAPVLILGESGRGKSTFAAACKATGALLRTDDGVMALHMVQEDHGEATARPRRPGAIRPSCPVKP